MPKTNKQLAAALAKQFEGQTLVVRGADGKPSLTDAGLQFVEFLAGQGKKQNFIATQLGDITFSTFKKMVGATDDANPVRLAWERGHAKHEDDVRTAMLVHGIKNPIPLMFYAKSNLGWRENDNTQTTVESNIKIVLPAPMSREAFFKSLGIEAPLPPLGAPKLIEGKALPAPESTPLYSTPTKGE